MDTKSCLMEFIGAFFLVFAVGMVTLTPGAGAIAPFVAGLTLLLMITIGGRISGGHYNPAVTLACLIKGDIGSERAVYYLFFQLIGAGIASIIVLFLKDYPSTTYLSVSIWHVLIVEFIYTSCFGFIPEKKLGKYILFLPKTYLFLTKKMRFAFLVCSFSCKKKIIALLLLLPFLFQFFVVAFAVQVLSIKQNTYTTTKNV